MHKLNIPALPRSHFFYLLLMIIHSGALVCLLVSQVIWIGKLLGLILVCVSFIMAMRKKSYSCQQIEDRFWLLTDLEGNKVSTQLLNNSLMTPFLIILNFKKFQAENSRIKNFFQWRYYSVVIFSDMLPAEQFRRLRRMLLNG